MNILEKIVVQKAKRLNELQQKLPFAELVKRVESKFSYPDSNGSSSTTFKQRLLPEQSFHVIAEIKRASPSKGSIPWSHPLEELLHRYEEGGASVISVLTEEDFFAGSDADFRTVRQLTNLPLLRKDFIFTEYQLYESAFLGTDFILLITSILEAPKLKSLIDLAHTLGLQPLVECRDEEEVEKALQAGATYLGINNRDLRTFEINLDRTRELSRLIPQDCFLISESGIHSPADAAYVSRAGANAILVGESCVQSTHPGDHIRALLEAGRSAKQA